MPVPVSMITIMVQSPRLPQSSLTPPVTRIALSAMNAILGQTASGMTIARTSATGVCVLMPLEFVLAKSRPHLCLVAHVMWLYSKVQCVDTTCATRK